MRVERTSAGALASDTRADATYVYCVVKSAAGATAHAPRPSRLARGLYGTGKPRLCDAGDGYQLLVASAPLSLYEAAAIDANLGDLDWVAERAAEHEAVVEHAAKLGTVVPMKLFTLFRNDERAVSHVRKMKRSLDAVVERIAGCEEWGLRILFDSSRVASAASRDALEHETASGTSFLRRKKALDEARQRAFARGTAAVEEQYERIANVARAVQRREPEGELAGRVVLDAVFLVPRESVKSLQSVVAASAESLVDDGFDVTLSGPWPAYSFIGER